MTTRFRATSILLTCTVILALLTARALTGSRAPQPLPAQTHAAAAALLKQGETKREPAKGDEAKTNAAEQSAIRNSLLLWFVPIAGSAGDSSRPGEPYSD